uniref:Myb-like domain-containing protein n=1 Tax=Brassica oleracea var. oleracea TaxID=109376 RepID=A0A0D3DAG6_BRAOL
MVTALSVSLGEEGKHRPFYLSIGGSPRRASGELSLYRWLSETMKNTIAAVEANRKVDRSRGMRHDPDTVRVRLCMCVMRWFDEEASHRFMRQRAYDCSYRILEAIKETVFSSIFNTLLFSLHNFSSFISLYLDPPSNMDYYPSSETSKFVDLLNSQQTVSFRNFEESVELSSSQVPFLGSIGTQDSNFDGVTGAERRERRKWTPTDDIVLISSCLNTSKDPVVGNEQKSGTFWNRVAAYFAASPLVAACEEREGAHCKHRWHRINDIVSKFCGAYEAATREKASGQNENDVVKPAHQIFYNNHKKKFNLEHAWKELRNDQKWCDLFTAKKEGSS